MLPAHAPNQKEGAREKKKKTAKLNQFNTEGEWSSYAGARPHTKSSHNGMAIALRREHGIDSDETCLLNFVGMSLLKPSKGASSW